MSAVYFTKNRIGGGGEELLLILVGRAIRDNLEGHMDLKGENERERDDLRDVNLDRGRVCGVVVVVLDRRRRKRR